MAEHAQATGTVFASQPSDNKKGENVQVCMAMEVGDVLGICNTCI